MGAEPLTRGMYRAFSEKNPCTTLRKSRFIPGSFVHLGNPRYKWRAYALRAPKCGVALTLVNVTRV